MNAIPHGVRAKCLAASVAQMLQELGYTAKAVTTDWFGTPATSIEFSIDGRGSKRCMLLGSNDEDWRGLSGKKIVDELTKEWVQTYSPESFRP